MTTLSMPRKKILIDQWEWDEDAQVWISATVAKGKGSPKSTMKCHLCGRRGHMAKQCKADLSKVKCFHCSKFGHIGAQCPDKPKGDKGKQQKKPQPKAGKSKGKGKDARVGRGEWAGSCSSTR